MDRRFRLAPAVLALTALALTALVACSRDEAVKPPTATVPEADTTTTTTALLPAPDLSRVPLPPVPGRARPGVDVRPGGATLWGTVSGPEGAVPGATVHAERLVGDAATPVDAVSGPDGRWVIGGIKGGRYRVRGWRPPDLVLLQSEILFLGGTEARELNMVLERQGGPFAVAATAPSPPLVNQPASLAIRLVQKAVDERGVVRAAPSPGTQVELTGPGQWQVRSANPTVTDAGGVARWQVSCLAPGTQPLAVILVGTPTAVPFAVPPCR